MGQGDVPVECSSGLGRAGGPSPGCLHPPSLSDAVPGRTVFSPKGTQLKAPSETHKEWL